MKRPKRANRSVPVPREALAATLVRVTEDYADFVNGFPREEGPPDPKAFAARQAAGRAALAHIVELASVAAGEAEAEASDDAPDPAEVLENARLGMAEEGER
jgi:hypothetical protein